MDNKKYISKIISGTDTLYVKDSEARESISNLQSSVTGAMHYIGTTTTEITDGSTVKNININEQQVTPKSGDVVIYGELEFVWSDATNKWQEFGSTGSLKSLAFKDSASGSTDCAGTNAPSAVTFSGQSSANVLSGIDSPAVAPSFTEGEFSAGTLPSLGAATTGSFATEGVIATYTESDETLTLTSASTSDAVTAQGTFNAGTLPSKAADTFNAGSAATFTNTDVISSVGTATAAAQTFTGATVNITVS